jgi:hypothetical protein
MNNLCIEMSGKYTLHHKMTRINKKINNASKPELKMSKSSNKLSDKSPCLANLENLEKEMDKLLVRINDHIYSPVAIYIYKQLIELMSGSSNRKAKIDDQWFCNYINGSELSKKKIFTCTYIFCPETAKKDFTAVLLDKFSHVESYESIEEKGNECKTYMSKYVEGKTDGMIKDLYTKSAISKNGLSMGSIVTFNDKWKTLPKKIDFKFFSGENSNNIQGLIFPGMSNSSHVFEYCMNGSGVAVKLWYKNGSEIILVKNGKKNISFSEVKKYKFDISTEIDTLKIPEFEITSNISIRDLDIFKNFKKIKHVSKFDDIISYTVATINVDGAKVASVVYNKTRSICGPKHVEINGAFHFYFVSDEMMIFKGFISEATLMKGKKCPNPMELFVKKK